MEAEILSFIRTNVPDMDHVKPHHIEQIADIEMVNILLSWKDWKEGEKMLVKVFSEQLISLQSKPRRDDVYRWYNNF